MKYIIITEKDKCENSREINMTKEMHICPVCGEIIEKDSIFCAYCGVDLKKYLELEKVEVRYDFEQTAKGCPECYAMNTMFNKFCAICGKKFLV